MGEISYATSLSCFKNIQRCDLTFYYPLASQMARKYQESLASTSSRLIGIQRPDKICLQESHPKQLPYLQSTAIKYLDWKLVTSCHD